MMKSHRISLPMINLWLNLWFLTILGEAAAEWWMYWCQIGGDSRGLHRSGPWSEARPGSQLVRIFSPGSGPDLDNIQIFKFVFFRIFFEFGNLSLIVNPALKCSDLPLFWKTQSQSLPVLSKVAKKILAIRAMSASSEKSHSAAGFMVDNRRSNLNPDTLDLILFFYSEKPGPGQTRA